MNLGLDLTTLNHTLQLTVNVFKSHRTGIFLRRQDLPGFVGIPNPPYSNLGIIDNKGFDGSLEYNGQFGPVRLHFISNITFNRNKDIIDGLPPWNYPWRDHEGRKLNQRFGYIALGLFKSKQEIANSPQEPGDVRPGDIKFKDINGDGKISPDDRVPIGYGSVPELSYGFGFTLDYKEFTLRAFFQGIGNVDIYLNGGTVQPFLHGLSRGNLFSNITDRWTKENPVPHPFYPRLAVGSVNDNYDLSTWWLRNGRYLRLRNVKFAYHFPDRWLKGAQIRSVQIFIAGRNVLTFSPFKLWDPELGNGRGATYPLLRTYSAGFDIKF